jgi:hypothetical protein
MQSFKNIYFFLHRDTSDLISDSTVINFAGKSLSKTNSKFFIIQDNDKTIQTFGIFEI